MTKKIVITVLSIFGGLIVFSALASSMQAEPKASAKKPSSTAVASPASPTHSYGDGTYLVGEDIPAGTLKTSGPPKSSFGCYWERATDDTGDFDSIIANSNVDGPARVTVSRGEVIKFSGDCNWVKIN